MKNKTIPVVIIIIVVALIIAYVYYSINQEKEQNLKEVVDYKVKLFEGVVCEYQCPLKLQQYENRTQLLPDLKCVKACTQEFRIKYPNANYTKEQLSTDNFFNDFEKIITDCQSQSRIYADYEKSSQFTMNNSAFFECAGEKLPELRFRYPYLVTNSSNQSF